METPWYVLHSKPRKEEFLLDQLRLNRYTAYCPLLKVTPVNPRSRKVRPYFPGYVFVQADLTRDKASSLQWMPGATGFVAFDGSPARVPEGFVPLLRQRVDAVNAAGGETLHEIQPGDTVRLVDGMFAGYEAVFDTRLPGTERVRVFLKLLQRRVLSVELPAGQVKKSGRR